jgi:hypothetical protein
MTLNKDKIMKESYSITFVDNYTVKHDFSSLTFLTRLKIAFWIVSDRIFSLRSKFEIEYKQNET